MVYNSPHTVSVVVELGKILEEYIQAHRDDLQIDCDCDQDWVLMVALHCLTSSWYIHTRIPRVVGLGKVSEDHIQVHRDGLQIDHATREKL